MDFHCYCIHIQYSSILYCIMVKASVFFVCLSAAALFFFNLASALFFNSRSDLDSIQQFRISGVPGLSLSIFTSSCAQSARTRYASAIVYVYTA
jgi:hypothetical protein